METETGRMLEPAMTFRHPVPHDAVAIWQLIRSTPPLDVNSVYLYAVLAEHFSQTCLVAEVAVAAAGIGVGAGETTTGASGAGGTSDAEGGPVLAGVVTGFIPPNDPTMLFIWQLAVAEDQRGSGVASALLRRLLAGQPRTVRFVSATVAPENHASRGVFTRFAAHLGAPIEFRPHLAGADLAPDGVPHPDEDLVVIGPWGREVAS